MKVISTEKLPIKMWLEDIDEGALEQAKNLANLPFAFKHIAIMPDSHQGYGMPIGGVLATKKVVVPNAVGVDIGCGVSAVKTSLTEIDTKKLIDILARIRNTIPIGFNHHEKKQDEKYLPELDSKELNYDWIPLKEKYPIVNEQYTSARHQIGTLGGGNHFIEFQKGSDGFIWIMIHSGSRNLGKKVADYYNKLAVFTNEQYYSIVPKSSQLAFFPIVSPLYKDYMREMEYCVQFAFSNRKIMMRRIEEIVETFYSSIEYEPVIDIAHNYAKMENHYGENVLVHRKGATLATTGTIGIIPGSQGTKSYIVKGKGNRESFNSCSHGAGRKMGRSQATRLLNLEDEIAKLDKQGIIHSIKESKDLDEATGAYKNIQYVMELQKDLVEIVVELSPLAVIKG